LVVINKIDQNPSFDVNRQHLQEKYKNIRGFYKLSCASQKGLDEFTSQMIKEIESVEYMRSQWAKSWFDVKEYLQNMKKNYITYDRYYEICNQSNVTDNSQQNTLLEYLHNLGVILHFENFALKDYQVLDPKWVTEAVYKVIKSEKLAECKGYLDKNMLEYILNTETFNKEEYHALLKNTKYTPLEQHYIISLMKTFELCYSINDDNFLVPDLLAVQEPGFVKTFDKKNALKFLYQFDFLPPSIIPRFIVKMNTDIKDQDLQWRTGVVLQDKDTGATAVVKADKEAKKIYVYVIGEYKQKREYLSVLRHALRDLIESFEKLQVTEGVPLPDYEDIVIEYDELKGYEEAGKDEYFIGKLKRTYSVGKLLDGIEPQRQRMRQYHGPPVNINIDNKPHMQFNPELDQHTESSSYSHAEVRAEISFQLEMHLPALQSQFDDLKLLLEEDSPELAKRLNDVDHELYQVDSKSDQKKLKRPLTKLGNLLRQLGDEKSEHSKFLRGAKKALECAQKLGRTYNKFAKWITTLPQIPEILVGKK
jgi:GTPase SAR1 family protein